MARVDNKVFEGIVEIGYPSKDEAGINLIGTGLLYADELQTHPDGSIAKIRPFVITNRHVLEHISQESTLYSIRLRSIAEGESKSEAKVLSFPLHDSEHNPIWLAHYDNEIDVAVLFLDLETICQDNSGVRCRFFRPNDFWTKQLMEDMGCSEGDNILVVGYPYSLEQIAPRSRAYPVVRSGIIARIADMYAGESKVFLVDATIYPGNSGSPVFTVPEALAVNKTKNILSSRVIGIISEYLDYRDRAISESTGRTIVFFSENSGLAKVELVDNILSTIELFKISATKRAAQCDQEQKMLNEELTENPPSD